MQDHIRSWLNARGVSNDTIALFGIHECDHPLMGEGTIVIPVKDAHGANLFNKYRRNPFAEHPKLPKYTYDKGGKVTLFGLDTLDRSKGFVVVTEGELDCLVLRSMHIPSVTSTGGALSFQEEWADDLDGLTVYVCFDNDDAGADGMVRVQKYIPYAKFVFIPEQPGVKDITDFVSKGGDFHALLQTARTYASLEEVIEDRAQRVAMWLPVRFHDAYIKEHTPIPSNPKKHYTPDAATTNRIERAKAVPCDTILSFTRNKACCPVHNESTPSLHWYETDNHCWCFGCGKGFDSIALYQAVNSAGFKEAVDELNKMV